MKRLKLFVINYITRHLLKAVTMDEVLVVSSKQWLVGKRNLSTEEILNLKEEARSFKESDVWKLMKKELKYGMTLQRYDKATTADDMIFGKAQAYCISQIELFVDNLTKL